MALVSEPDGLCHVGGFYARAQQPASVTNPDQQLVCMRRISDFIRKRAQETVSAHVHERSHFVEWNVACVAGIKMFLRPSHRGLERASLCAALVGSVKSDQSCHPCASAVPAMGHVHAHAQPRLIFDQEVLEVEHKPSNARM
jgi:hypothetical protein